MDLPALDMQAPEALPAVDSSHPGSSHHLDRTSGPLIANRLGLHAAYLRHCAPATDAAYERHAGQAMHILALPPPTSLPPTPFGRRQEPVSSLAKVHPQFSPARSEQHSYPSPPMSDSTSPARRSAHLVDPEGHPYPPSTNEARRLEALPPPPRPPPSFDPRLASPAQGISHQRPLYPGEGARAPVLQHQPGRAIEPPYYGSVQLPQNYAYGYAGAGVPSFLGSQGPGPQGQPTAIIAPPSLRPSKPARRTKAHVASACVNCKKAHLSCDVQRPCGRCVASGKQDSCKDVQHKKRGRPRLRDDKDFGRSEEGRHPTQLLGPLPVSGPDAFAHQSAFSSSHRGTDPLRILKSSTREAEAISNALPQLHTHAAIGRPASRGYGQVSASPYAAAPNLAYQQSLPVAFLNLDLVVLKSNQAFQDLVSVLGELRGKSLHDLIEARSSDVLQRIKNDLRDERDRREPSYMAPITPLGHDPVQSVSERDVDQVSQGYTDRPALLNFRFSNGHHQALQTQIRLAKTSLFFVTLVVHTPIRPAGPPLLTQQLAPPTPTHSSQTQSAPTTVPVREYTNLPRPPSSASSAPTSPYFNFNTVRTSLPNMSTGSYGSSPSYNYSPTAGAEQGYFPTIQPPAQPGSYPSPYPPVSRTNSVTSEPLRGQTSIHDAKHAAPTDGLQLPPIRTAPGLPLHSPPGHEFGDPSRNRPHPREMPQSVEYRDPSEAGKRRRLNIHEVLE